MSRTSIYNYFLFFLLFNIISCQNPNELRPYYYPVEDLIIGKVYEYQSVHDKALPPIYQYYATLKQDNNTYLTGMQYNEQLEPQQFVREEIIKNGVLLADTYLYQTDSLGKQQQIPIDIQSGNVFPFEAKDSSIVYLYKIQWQETSDSLNITNTLIKNRRFQTWTTYNYQGQTYDCVEFSTLELIDNEIEGQGHLEIEMRGKELYAKGIGLVYYEKAEVHGNFSQAYELVDMYGMENLTAKLESE